MSVLMNTVREWLHSNGYESSSGVELSVTAQAGGVCRITLAPAETKCVRCATKGPGIGARLTGRCSTCSTVRDRRRGDVVFLKSDLVPLLRESFDFEQDEALRDRYLFVRDGVADNGAVVHIFLKEKEKNG